MNLPLSLMLTDIITEEPSTSSNSLMGSQCISLISPVHFRYHMKQTLAWVVFQLQFSAHSPEECPALSLYSHTLGCPGTPPPSNHKRRYHAIQRHRRKCLVEEHSRSSLS